VRIAVSGGAPISPQIARFFTGLGISLVQGYGLTEVSPVISLSPPPDNRPDNVSLPSQALLRSAEAPLKAYDQDVQRLYEGHA